MKPKFQPNESDNDDALIIGSLTFTKQTPPKLRGGPRCVLSTNAKGRADLRINAVQLQALPQLGAVERVSVYLAPDKPTIALIPSADGNKFRGEKSGARKITGTALRTLAAKYQRIIYRVEAIESPRKGWLLTAIESERRNA